jgi:zinc D-Ala-D-Ala carboxypeptidase
MLQVSPHFSLAELTATDHREFLAAQGAPPPDVLMHLRRLAIDLLEPARALVGPLRVNSGWRCPELNAAIGGSKTSAHMLGLAADVYPLEMDPHDAYVRLAESGLPIDQVIWEFDRWIHLGAALPGKEPRGHRYAIWEPGRYEQWRESDPRFSAARRVS